MTPAEYIDTISKRYALGNATEHTFRGDLQQLLESLVPYIRATNEPRRQKCGAPDYILTKKEIPVGFIEAKDIGDKDLEGKKKSGNKEQFDRYKASLNNLIFTDYLDFHFYQEGKFITKIAIGELTEKGIKPLPENFRSFEALIKDFCTHIDQTIKSSKKLAEMMAGKARLLSDIIEKSLTSDEENQENSTLKDQMLAFKQILIHDITPQGFADVYAQTIAYGMFAARYHDPTLETFSRQEAAELIPKSNPFLRKLFGYIAGPDIDDRIKWVVENLAEIFLACNVKEILKDYGKATKMEDPIIHFYENFLSEYDPKLRKSRGVWYTPQPVVDFIVRAVDDILKKEFDLPQGLADSSKTEIKVEVQGKKVKQETHRVQILDPATGTGTFLAEVVKHIHKNFQGQEGAWRNYVEMHLLPRLNGFELLMASYAMAHLKLDLLLSETGFKATANQRFRVYLTNSLEEEHPDAGTLFANWLSAEANEANHIKRDTPVMCVIGNPPYSGESANKGEWIMSLMEDYKKEPGGKERLKERNAKWLNDDYVKFLRYGQHFIEKNESGILAFINPHGFLDNPTFRGMRWNLLKTYDKIYTIDLHGNSKKKETAPDGSPDVNVFDIQQGVSINIFVKTGKKKANALGKVFHYDLYGKRELKYDFLNENSLQSIDFKELPNVAPNYFMVQKDFEAKKVYDKGFSISELFTINSVGVVTARDEFTIHNTKAALKNTLERFLALDTEEARREFNLGKDVRDWKVSLAKKDVELNYLDNSNMTKITYRPFDERWTFYTGNSKGFHCMPRREVMQHFLAGENLGLIAEKIMMNKRRAYYDCFITNKIYDAHAIGSASYSFPLYLYPEKALSKKLFTKESEKAKLEAQLELAKANYKEVKKYFEGVVLPFYEAIPAPNKEHEKLFEENKTQYEEAKSILENLQEKLERLKAAKPQSTELFSQERKPNLNAVIAKKIAKGLRLIYIPNVKNPFETGKDIVLKALKKTRNASAPKRNHSLLNPIDILDYIYAVLHSPSYREKYKAFLKIDFPRVPYPKDQDTFWKLVKLGGEIRQIHVLESPKVEQYITQYPVSGDNMITRKITKSNPGYVADTETHGKVWINDEQYFDNVPLVAWEFYIGGYQPAQKWLKDRKGRKLESDDIFHYQKIIVALTETDRLMREIGKIDIE